MGVTITNKERIFDFGFWILDSTISQKRTIQNLLIFVSVIALSPFSLVQPLEAVGKEPVDEPSSGFAASKEQPVTAELIAEHASVQPGGETRIGVHFDLEEDWHIYAEDPGDAGLPTKIAWQGPSEVSFGPLRWPAPQRFHDPGEITTFGYTGTVVLSSTLTVSRQAAPGRTLPLQATVKWLACKEVCVPGSTTLELALPVSSNAPVFSTHAEFFDHTS